MTTLEILQRLANIHNMILRVFVNGDNAVLIGESIKELRDLIGQLNQDVDRQETSDPQRTVDAEEG